MSSWFSQRVRRSALCLPRIFGSTVPERCHFRRLAQRSPHWVKFEVFCTSALISSQKSVVGHWFLWTAVFSGRSPLSLRCCFSVDLTRRTTLQSLYLIWLVKDTVALVNIVPPEALAPVLGCWDAGDRVKTLLVTGGQ